MTPEELLASPVGKAMVEAVLQERYGYSVQSEGWWEKQRSAVRDELAAALRVAMSTICMTCGGKGHLRIAPPEGVKTFGENIVRSCTNPDCKDGKVTPPIYALLGIETSADTLRRIARMGAGETIHEEDVSLYVGSTGTLGDSEAQHMSIRIERLEAERER